MPQVQLQIETTKRASVQRFPLYGERTPPLLLQVAIAADEAPPWWTPSRDDYLRTFWLGEPFLASAIYTLMARNAGFRWEIETNNADHKRWAINLLNTAEFGQGWQELVLKVSEDLYTQDNGGFIEIIRPARATMGGKSYQAFARRDKQSGDIAWYAITNRFGEVTPVPAQVVSDSPADYPIGLAHLDARKCVRTGDPDRPVIYVDRYGTEHWLEDWQVITMTDMPSPIEEMHAVGFCMVSRVLRDAQTVRDWTIYREEKISGRFARAVHLTNVDADLITDAIEKASADADSKGLLRYSQPIITNTLDPNARPWNVTIPLAQLPEGWDEDTMMRWYIALVALAAGEHYSFMAPMPGRRLGSAKEVEVQERQARGKSSRLWMDAIVTKFANAKVFPPDCAMVFKDKDPAEEEAKNTSAELRAKTRAERIMSGEITAQIARQIAVDDGDLKEAYLTQMGEVDVTPETGEGMTLEPTSEAQPDESQQVTTEEPSFEQKQTPPKGQPPEPWGDKAVPITKEDMARAIAKWNERMPAEAQGILQARTATAEEETEAAEEPAEEEKGSGESGYYEPHYGRPGKRGGSKPRGHGEPQVGTVTGYVLAEATGPAPKPPMDIEEEGKSVWSWHGQRGEPRPGVTREQLVRYTARREAWLAAERLKYSDGSTVKEHVDAAIARGLTKVIIRGRWTILANADETDGLQFSTKTERDYIDVVLNRGKLARNYDVGEKGSDKSGHHGHRGRPGQVGGSVPSGRQPEEHVDESRLRPAEEEQEPEVSVGITSARPGKTREQVLAQMRGFAAIMHRAGIKNFRVIQGRGAWQGGWEPTWVVTYDGDGAARDLILETAKRYDQDAVLFMYRSGEGGGASPRTRFNFDRILGDAQINRVEEELAERKFGGWTWYNTPKGSTLMAACVPQWGGDPATHRDLMTTMRDELRQSGYGMSVQHGWVRTEVVEKPNYDAAIAAD